MQNTKNRDIGKSKNLKMQKQGNSRSKNRQIDKQKNAKQKYKENIRSI